ncbi:MAG: DUF1109 family protein [Betaproteobacteria bacterium]|nr:DUF1109 family protein [Betaproteobacteria bacterium]
MKTDTLIEMLARQAGPAPDFPVGRHLAAAASLGLLASSVLALALIGPLPAAVFYTAAPWIKLVYAVLLLVGTSALAARLSRPVSSTVMARAAVTSVFLLMLLAGAVTLITTPEGGRWSALLGQTWWICPWMLMMLSLPALTAILWAMRSLAPTRLKQAGFAAGLVAGVLGAMGYSLACPETSVAFVAIWYSMGIALTGWVGQWLGPEVLRW